MSRGPEVERDWLFGAAMSSIVLISVLLAVGAAILGFFLGRDTKPKTTPTAASTQVAPSAVDPHVAGGAHLFVQFACAQCHGPQGQGGVSPAVPALSQAGQQLTAGATSPHHQSRSRRISQSETALHARLGCGHFQ